MKKNILAFAFVIVFAFIFAACPKVPPEETGDPLLIGTWTNNKAGSKNAEEVKTFTVNQNFTFSCSINPGKNGNYQGRATVTGTLTPDGGGIYSMSDLQGTPDPPDQAAWTAMLGSFNTQRIKITFNNNDAFNFKSAQNNAAVTEFFGGDYDRVIP
jgi:hypothetical protein